jgi:hypothetical protein
MATTDKAPGSSRVFIVKLRPLPSVDAIKALRRGLKYLLRKCGLRCTEIREETQWPTKPPNQT